MKLGSIIDTRVESSCSMIMHTSAIITVDQRQIVSNMVQLLSIMGSKLLCIHAWARQDLANETC